MTEQESQKASAFSQRSDNAATQLKQAMGLPSRQVQVLPNGHPPAQPPPPNSYARAAYDEAVAAQARIVQAEQRAQQDAPQEEPQPQPRELPNEQVSDKAAERIKELVDKLRDKDQEFQQLQESHNKSETQIAELRQVAEQLQAQYAQMLDRNLESLTPDERAQVISSAQVQQAVSAAEQRILKQLQPRLERIDQQVLAKEYEALAAKYPEGFDARVHPSLIEDFRKSNPKCSVEMAFRAVATDEELTRGSGRSANPVPPSLSPNHSSVPKSLPVGHLSQPATSPDQEIAEEAEAAFKLRRSSNPHDQKAGMRAIEANLQRRFFGS